VTCCYRHLIRSLAVVLLLLAASPVTQPFATIDLSGAPVAHESAHGATIKHKLAHDDSVVVVPRIAVLPLFFGVQQRPIPLAAAVRRYPLHALILRI